MRTIISSLLVLILLSPFLVSCDQPVKVRIIFDTDANNELEHATVKISFKFQ